MKTGCPYRYYINYGKECKCMLGEGKYCKNEEAERNECDMVWKAFELLLEKNKDVLIRLKDGWN